MLADLIEPKFPCQIQAKHIPSCYVTLLKAAVLVMSQGLLHGFMNGCRELLSPAHKFIITIKLG